MKRPGDEPPQPVEIRSGRAAGHTRGGKAFEYEFGQSAKAFSLYYQRKSSGGIRGEGATRFVKQEPYDGYLVIGGLYCPVELKSAKEHGSLYTYRLPDHQVQGLSRVLKEGGCPFLFVNMRRAKSGGKTRPENRAWALPFDRYADLIEEMSQAGRKSIPYAWFLDPARFAPVERLPRYDVKPACWDLVSGLAAACLLAKAPQYEALSTLLCGTSYRRDHRHEGVAR